LIKGGILARERWPLRARASQSAIQIHRRSISNNQSPPADNSPKNSRYAHVRSVLKKQQKDQREIARLVHRLRGRTKIRNTIFAA